MLGKFWKIVERRLKNRIRILMLRKCREIEVKLTLKEKLGIVFTLKSGEK
jgi:hypothetical protein